MSCSVTSDDGWYVGVLGSLEVAALADDFVCEYTSLLQVILFLALSSVCCKFFCCAWLDEGLPQNCRNALNRYWHVHGCEACYVLGNLLISLMFMELS